MNNNLNEAERELRLGWFPFLVLFFVFSTYPKLVYAQACCSGGVPLGGSLGLTTTDKSSLQFLITYDANIIHDLVDETTVLDDNTRNRRTNSFLMEINYGLSDRIAITAVIPYIQQIRTINGFNSAVERTATQGLGDMVFMLKYLILAPSIKSKSSWVVGIGPKAPTGRTTFENQGGLILQADMQPGSGSWDTYFWSFYQKNQFIIPSISLLNVISYRRSGKNKTYNESQTYQFGDEFQLNVGLNYNSFISKWPVDFFTFLRFRSQTEDFIDNSIFPSTGGKWIFLIPGINWAINPDMAIRFSSDIPLARSLEGTQLTTSSRMSLSFFYNLPFKKNTPINSQKFLD